MTDQSGTGQIGQMDRLAKAASLMGYEVVDVAGFLDLVEAQAHQQLTELKTLDSSAERLQSATDLVSKAVSDMVAGSEQTLSAVHGSVAFVRRSTEQTQGVANWVHELAERTQTTNDTLRAVKTNNAQIASIATQVNTLAINAKIEAARAGDSGRGFAIVAEAINELSQNTRKAAQEISDNIEILTDWITTLASEADTVSQEALELLKGSAQANTALTEVVQAVEASCAKARVIDKQSSAAKDSMASFTPSLTRIGTCVQATSSGIEQAHSRVFRLIDTSETMVQLSAQFAGENSDSRFIAYVQHAASEISRQFDAALASGRITEAQLFDTNYKTIPGTDPEQVSTDFTRLTDTLLPAIQEPAFEFDPKVVFCAAVDKRGYLPTHNLKFSQPQGADPVWNMAHCRNRRIFDDRVGLKAGRNSEPFLLQVYRRDMGGGEFTMMKDLSAPIFANGRHWGGLRLAYRF